MNLYNISRFDEKHSNQTLSTQFLYYPILFFKKYLCWLFAPPCWGAAE